MHKQAGPGEVDSGGMGAAPLSITIRLPTAPKSKTNATLTSIQCCLGSGVSEVNFHEESTCPAERTLVVFSTTQVGLVEDNGIKEHGQYLMYRLT